MAQKPGGFTNAGIKHTGTWGTAGAIGTGGKVVGLQITPSMNVQSFEPNAIGSGAYMRSAAYILGRLPSISLSGSLGYANGCDIIIAHILGTSGVPTEVTTDEDDYLHTITVNTTFAGGGYTTFAFDSSTGTVQEMASVLWTQFTIGASAVPGEVTFSCEGVANDITLSGTENSNAELASATTAETLVEFATVEYGDTHWMNAQSGAELDSGDVVPVTNFSFNFNRPAKLIGEIKGTAGVGAPVSDGVITATLELGLKEQADHTWWTIWNAETAQKAKLAFSGSVINAGTAKSVSLYLPYIKLVEAPNYAVVDEGTNPVTLNFTCLRPSANPTGMSSTYPYFEWVNTRSASLLA